MKKTLNILFILILVSGIALAGNLDFNSGKIELYLKGSDATVNMSVGGNYSDVSVTSRKLVTKKGNFSVLNFSSSHIDIRLEKFNLSSSGNFTVFAANTTDGKNVQFGLEGLSSSTYIIWKDGSKYATKDVADGSLYFNNSVWSYHTFKISKDNSPPTVQLSVSESEVNTGSSVTFTCDTSDESGINSQQLDVEYPDGSVKTISCGSSFGETSSTGIYTGNLTATDNAGNTNFDTASFEVVEEESSGGGGGGGSATLNTVYSHSWDVNPKTVFEADGIKEKIEEILKVRVQTQKQTSEMELTVDKLSSNPTTQSLDDIESFIEIKVNTNVKVESGSISFRVNNEFAQKYDEVQLLRYHQEKWNKLDTELKESSGEKWVYTAKTPGFSYFAIKGVRKETTQEKNETSQNQDDSTNQTKNANKSEETSKGNICGNNKCGNNETAVSCPQDCATSSNVKNIGRTEIQQWLPFIIILVAALVSIIALYYKEEIREKIETLKED